jgi:endonuclease G
MNRLFLILLMVVCLVACDGEQHPFNGHIDTTQTDSELLVLKGYEGSSKGFSVFKPVDFDTPFYIEERQFVGKAYAFVMAAQKRLDEMKDIPTSGWVDAIQITSGATYWVRYSSLYVNTYVKLRVAYIQGNDVGVEYVIEKTEARPNANSNLLSSDKAAHGFEIPRLDAENYFTAHYVMYKNVERMNYAVEWNAALRHANWVAYSFDKITAENNVTRSDLWMWDPTIPFEMGGVDEADHKSDGYDKGHICGSEDRVYSREANDQTFYYTNITPQLNQFNSGFWLQLENRVRVWGRSTRSGTFDRLYVCKGGTMNHLHKNFEATKKGMDGRVPTADEDGRTIHGLAVPAYYFMALLAEKDGQYQGMGFLLPHSVDLPAKPSFDELKAEAITIDELEQFSGLDFFCNLPDEVETACEAKLNANAWNWE